MHKGRLEAFSDAVIAIDLTIMVLEMHPPIKGDLAALREVAPVFGPFVLSFVYLAIYWNNHHHMLQVAKQVNGSVLWANMHLLFWLTLVPFVTSWMGHAFAAPTVLCYGFVLMMAGIAYYILSRTLVRANGADSDLAQKLGTDVKGKVSVVVYAVAIGLAFVSPIVSCAMYIAVALMWLVPDRRFEHRVPPAPGVD